jgi:hypothetical protein
MVFLKLYILVNSILHIAGITDVEAVAAGGGKGGNGPSVQLMRLCSENKKAYCDLKMIALKDNIKCYF